MTGASLALRPEPVPRPDAIDVDALPPPPLTPDFSDHILADGHVSFLAYEAYVASFHSAAFARAVTQTGAYTLLLPPPSTAGAVPSLSAHDRRGYLRLLNAARVAAHIHGTFTSAGANRPLARGEPARFPPLLPAAGEQAAHGLRDKTYWVYRVDGGNGVVVRSEPRAAGPFVVDEWSFDVARVSRPAAS